MEKTVYQSHDKGKFYVLLRTNDLEIGKYHIKIILQTNEIESYQNYYVDFEIIE